MAFVVLQCMEPYHFFSDKILKLEHGVPESIGKCYTSAPNNGYFEEKYKFLCSEHALVLYDSEQFFLEDRSINGTYLNGHRLLKNLKYAIISGDVIQLGNESFSTAGAGNINVITISVKLFKDEDADFIDLLTDGSSYVMPLQLYHEIPELECSLTMVQKSIANRLEALKILDSFGNIDILTPSIKKCIFSRFREKALFDVIKLVLGTSNSYQEEYNLQKVDHLSHFMICLACSRNFVMQKWFLDQETKLLFLRWMYLSRPEKHKTISEYFRQFKKVTEHEKRNLAITSNGFIDPSVTYYKVCFTIASELIAKRMVYMKNGICYIPFDDFIYVIKYHFIKYLKHNLETIKRNLHHVWNDERITAVISYIENEVQFERFFSGRSTSSLILKEIDSLAEESFPLCMNILHFHLKRNNHLKNDGRFQYGLFLKGIGLSLRDAQTFWRNYFTKRMTLHEFIKNYNYYIFHLYGAVGKKANYPPASCKRILNAVPSFGNYNGCPFKLYDEENITSLLERHKLNTEEIRCIVDIMNTDMPQSACSKYFEIKHGLALKETVYHPNVYFQESRTIYKDRAKPQSSDLSQSAGPSQTQNETKVQSEEQIHSSSASQSGVNYSDRASESDESRTAFKDREKPQSSGFSQLAGPSQTQVQIHSQGASQSGRASESDESRTAFKDREKPQSSGFSQLAGPSQTQVQIHSQGASQSGRASESDNKNLPQNCSEGCQGHKKDEVCHCCTNTYEW